MRTRIRLLRKKLKLNQKDFGARLNLSENFVGLIENGGRNPSDRTIADICREYNVSEEWLRSGTGEMFQPEKDFSLDELAREKGATELELAIMKAYFNFSDETRAEIRARLSESISALFFGKSQNPPKDE